MSMPPELFPSLIFCVFAALVVFAAARDAVSYTIPNWVSAALALAFVPAAFALRVPWPVIGWSVIVGVMLLGVGMAMFAVNWIGGGDAKLMAAASLWIGYTPSLALFALFTGVAGGALAIALIALRSAWVRPLATAGPAWVGRLATPGAAAPYGVAIAAGALAAFPHGVVLQAGHAAF